MQSAAEEVVVGVVWVIVGVVAVLAGSRTPERANAMVEIGWKSAALCAALAVVGIFWADMAPSQLNWSALTGMWAFLMMVAFVWSRGAYPDRADSD
jgi:Ca2+/Na+ antiporter